MKGLFLIFLLLLEYSFGAYLVEYTHLLPQKGVMLAVHCDFWSNPDCGTAYQRATSYSLKDTLEYALEYINRQGASFLLDESPKGFEFVKLYRAEEIPTEYIKVGEEEHVVQEPKVVKKDKMEWTVKKHE